MPEAQLPPYLGTWSALLKAVLNDPSIGGGKGGHPHKIFALTLPKGSAGSTEESLAALTDPDPVPWLTGAALILGAIGAARAGKNGSSAIAKFVDDFCGTPPRPHPWWFATAAGIGQLGENLPAGSLRDDVLMAASLLMQKALPGAKTTGSI